MEHGYDVIVVGLGAMGSATAHRLARSGQRVLGLEQFAPAHALGSSHGGSRIYRQAYAEGADYVPLLLRAREGWDELSGLSGQNLFLPTGGLMIGRPDTALVSGTLHSAHAWELEHEVLSADDVARRFPTFRLAHDEVAVHENAAGVVRPELTVRACLDLAVGQGAELRFNEPVTDWQSLDTGGAVVTTRAGRYRAERLVLTPGAWAPGILAGRVPLSVERRVMHWFQPIGGTDAFAPHRHPVHVWDDGTAEGEFYGFPALDGPAGGVKVAFHGQGGPADPDELDRAVRADEIERMREALRTRLPALRGTHLRAAACMYVNTRDEHFVINAHPDYENVVMACGFSGHGFKFVPVVAEILSDLAVRGTTEHPIGLFDPHRLDAGGPQHA
ncbi:N-methyl-L-tryptophan oxidase [Streptomyces sp. NPDC001661]